MGRDIKVVYKGESYDFKNVETYGDLVALLGQQPKQVYYTKINDAFVDLPSKIDQDSFEITLHSSTDKNVTDYLWHTSAHILAQAIKRLYPDMKEAIGPVTSSGFFEDIDFINHTLTPPDLENIHLEMQKIIEADYKVEKELISYDEALERFKDNPYKVANLANIPKGEQISVYKQGEYEDLCRGPHLYSTGQVGAFLLTNISSAYFQGDKTQKSLQRISGISFTTKKELKKYELFLEEAKKRDHRKLGQELDLFSFQPQGPGFPFWHSKGNVIFNLLIDYMRRENTKRGYLEVKTPQVLLDELWKQSGHYENFQENMYFTPVDERDFALKPMNCPGGCLIYKSSLHSYRDLPLKQAEFGLVHRHELSGVLHGLFRVRSFTQDDAHIFCTPEQLEQETKETIEYVLNVYKDFGFNDMTIFIATRPEKSIGSDESWNLATKALCNSLEALSLDYTFKEGEGAFYGPKIEFNIKDSLERHWQCGTIQIDFSMPERFNLSYEGSDGKSHTPIMVHRAILGSFERFIGILIEHYSGKFPLWLAPVQIQLINVNEVHLDYVTEVENYLKSAGVRVEVDRRNESLSYKIRAATKLKAPFMGIIGDKEMAEKSLTLRDRNNESKTYTLEEIVSLVNESNK